MIANYHTHTVRCNHALGGEEEYIAAALEAGLEELGFSDHTPQPFGGNYYSKMRMRPHELAEYVTTLRSLQDRYAHRLTIRVGLETEYYPACFPTLLQWVRREGIDYMILGQHWLGNEEGEQHVYHAFEDPHRLQRYCDQAVEAMRTGAFSYFAHPDIVNFCGDPALYDRAMTRLIREAIAWELPLEYNLHGLACGVNYPHHRFWELAAAEGAQVILGRDAHRPEELLDAETELRARTHLASLNITPLTKLKLKKP